MKSSIFYALCLALMLIQCSDDDDNLTDLNTGGTGQDWLIPLAEIKDGGPGKDGIPSIDSPKFVSANNSKAEFLKDFNLVIGYVNGNEAKAYPHLILDWHEVVNEIGQGTSISYCPLTGTAFAWKSPNTTFGVSGLLYNANLIVYDRKTNSNWSQLSLKCVNGNQIGQIPEVLQLFEMSWGAWKQLFPNTQVLIEDTGFSRSYGTYPYGSYRTNNENFIFPVTPTNNAIASKERVFAIINKGKTKVYQFGKFGSGSAVKDNFNGVDYLVVGNNDFYVGFELENDYKNLTYTYDFNSEGDVTVFNDDEGNKWSIEGVALSGPRSGQRLKPSTSVMSYWFAIAAFYPDPEIFQ